MPIRLIDPNHTKVVNISGTKFHIRSLTAAQQMKMGLLWRSESAPEFTDKMIANYNQIAECIAPAIAKIEGHENQSALTVLLNMADVSDFMALFSAVMEYSTLKESESKNSRSSSDTSPAKPMGDKS